MYAKTKVYKQKTIKTMLTIKKKLKNNKGTILF